MSVVGYMMDKTNPFASLFLINGKAMPWIENGSQYIDYYEGNAEGSVCNPGRDYQEKTEQLVRSTRNANGQVIAQVINRRLNKFDNLYWPYLSAESVTWLKQQIAQFNCKLTYWDSELGSVITREYYWGDFEATPCEWSTILIEGYYMKKPTHYKDVKCNLIDRRVLERSIIMALEQKYLNVQLRQEAYLEIMMYVPDTSVRISSVSSNDILSYSNINAITNIKQYSSTTIATLEENLWLLNGKFPNIVDGTTTPGYISDSMSDDDGEFEENPKIIVNLSNTSHIEDFSIMLNPSTPSAYPVDINIYAYNGDTLVRTFTKNIITYTQTINNEGETVVTTSLLETLPSVLFEMNIDNITKLEIEFVGTRYPHRRIRVSTLLFGKMIYLDQNKIISSDFMDKTSYACDTIPSRIFKFDLNNYAHKYDVDNPNNTYINLDSRTIVQFRSGYNVYGYKKDEHDNLVLDSNGYPIIENPYRLSEIEWDDWKELRLVNVYANSDESVTFECGSTLDIMDKIYTQEYFNGNNRTVGEIADDILSFCGMDLSTIEWSSDGIKKPTYDGNILLPYEQWEDTSYRDYEICTVLPESPCREIIQLLAFSVGATILIKDNGKIKFANLDINKPSTFTHQFEWTYKDFEDIPEAEQLESISSLNDLSLPKYTSRLDNSEGVKEIGTMEISAINAEVTYSECSPTGASVSQDDTSGATVQSSNLFARRGILNIGGLVEGSPAKVVIYGYPIITDVVQERNVTSETLVLDTKLMNYDVSTYYSSGNVKQSDQIKRKYLEWYKKKFKYKIKTRGEPLVDAGDYGIVQTQFTEEMPVYILQNHWTFDGTWAGDMEVITLD